MLSTLSIEQRLAPFSGEPRRSSHGPLLPANYDHLAFAARGKFTEVHLVQDRNSQTPSALKQLRSEWLDDARARHSLTNEIRARRQIRSQYVPQYSDGDTECQRPFLVTEWVRGERLSDRLKVDGPLPVRRSLWIARQCAFALQQCHDSRWSHGNFGPDRILIADDGAVKLIGFGYAQSLDADDEPNLLVSELTAPTGLFDTGLFDSSMNPVAKDAYDLGATLYWMLTGHSPFGDARLTRLLGRHVVAQTLHSDDCSEGTPRALIDLVNLLLAETPTHVSATLDSVTRELIELELSAMG